MLKAGPLSPHIRGVDSEGLLCSHPGLEADIAATSIDIKGVSKENQCQILSPSVENESDEPIDPIPTLRIDELARPSPDATSPSNSSSTRRSLTPYTGSTDDQDIKGTERREVELLVVRMEDIPPSEDLDDPFGYEPSDQVMDDLPEPAFQFVQQLLQASWEKNVSVRVKHVRIEESSDEEDEDDDDDDGECLISARRYAKRPRLTNHMVSRIRSS